MLHSSRVDFPTTTTEQLQSLAEFCQPAKFGVNQQDVFDETYRKASKLDAEDFMIGYDPLRSGVLDIVHSELAIDRRGKQDAIRAELYKLNIYGVSSCPTHVAFRKQMTFPRRTRVFLQASCRYPT